MNRDEEYVVKGTIPNLSAENDQFLQEEFKRIFEDKIINVKELRKCAWNGVPSKYRALTFRILTGYISNVQDRHTEELKTKRSEYQNLKNQNYDNVDSDDEDEIKALKVIGHDVKRTYADTEIFCHPVVSKMLTRLLFIFNNR